MGAPAKESMESYATETSADAGGSATQTEAKAESVANAPVQSAEASTVQA